MGYGAVTYVPIDGRIRKIEVASCLFYSAEFRFFWRGWLVGEHLLDPSELCLEALYRLGKLIESYCVHRVVFDLYDVTAFSEPLTKKSASGTNYVLAV